MRFLACSQNCPSTRNSLIATAILQLLTDTFRKLWKTRLPDFPLWLCDNSEEVVGMVNRYNAAQLPLLADAPNPHQPCQYHPAFSLAQAFDFTRLYTNLPRHLIRTVMEQLVHACFLFANVTYLRVAVNPPRGAGST